MNYDAIVVGTDVPARCLEAVRAQSVPPAQVIVTDDRTAGARQATADVVLFVDHDVVPEPDAAAELCALLSDEVLASGGVLPCAERRSRWRALLGQTHLALRPRDTGSLFKASGFVSLVPTPSSTVDVHFLPGGLLACHRKTVLDVPFTDEVDFSNRVSRLGRLVQTPRARAHRVDSPDDPYSLGYPGAYFRWHAREPGLIGSTWWVVAHLSLALRVSDARAYLRGCLLSVRRLWQEQTW